MKGSNSKQNKALNLRLVLSEIVTQGPISRVEISRQTHLTKQTITNMVEELLAIGLVEEIGIKKEGAVGKPSKMLNLTDTGAYSVALRIFPEKIEAGLFSLKGEAVLLNNVEYQTADLIPTINQLLETLIEQANIQKAQILGVGVTFVNETHNSLATYQEGLAFKQALADALSLPVATESTASACAAYQMLYGEAKQLHSFICIHLSDVVEAAVVYDRKILLGKNGLTGAIGELFVTPETDEKTVELGRLNDFASLKSLKKFLGVNAISHEALAELCFEQKKTMETWFEQAAEPMRIAIHSLETLLNCQTIIIGGDVSSWFLDKFITKLRPYIPSIAQYGELDVVRLIKTPHVEEVALKGSATLPLHAALSVDNMQTLCLPSSAILAPVHSLIYLGD
ncbi:ROK family transcriptional regulator [Colwellia sp. 1_MG-2023]|uniref:ROK family transcriptional regulator n=1 Tax=Colwellia sp. 1_MG-2023 TaxID=3062649 RepID=UPI0026E30E84|nr:ROK family transcriptional regulator [Colwellia sp. 1_MG-2023]MDO6447142.1 ROK family transcriptional regulator [Colwellia sp. 1_MG-2023]